MTDSVVDARAETSHLDSRTDQELIAAINAGNNGAFEVLYFRYRDWVTSMAFRFTGDADIALDVLQETFLYLLKKFPGFRLTSQLKTFLYPAIRNLSISARQKARRYQSTNAELTAIESAPANPVSADTGDIAAALSRLSEDHREVLLLRFVDGLALNEIAAATGIPLGTVKSRLHHALESLRADPRTRQFFQ